MVVLVIYIVSPSLFGGCDATVVEEVDGSSTVSLVDGGCPRLRNSAQKRIRAHRLTYICIRKTHRGRPRGHREFPNLVLRHVETVRQPLLSFIRGRGTQRSLSTGHREISNLGLIRENSIRQSRLGANRAMDSQKEFPSQLGGHLEVFGYRPYRAVCRRWRIEHCHGSVRICEFRSACDFYIIIILFYNILCLVRYIFTLFPNISCINQIH